MSTYLVLKALHVAGVVVAFVGVAGLAAHAASGGTRAQNPLHGLLAAFHGAGLLVALACAFGMLYLNGMGRPGTPSVPWVAAKTVCWMLLGAASVLPYRSPSLARRVLGVGLPVLALLAVGIAVLKPF